MVPSREYKDASQPRWRPLHHNNTKTSLPLYLSQSLHVSTKMKYALAFAGLVAGVLAGGECYVPNPEPTPAPTPDQSLFTVISSRSASPIHLLPLTARNGKFYLGAGNPTSSCPESVGSSCPPGTSTVFMGGSGTLGLGVVVPGGQQIYVAQNGELSYTVPHSAAIPNGAIVDQFSKTAPGSNNLGTLSFETGFVACPVGNGGQGYQVYGQNQGFEASSDCLGFSALTCKSIHDLI